MVAVVMSITETPAAAHGVEFKKEAAKAAAPPPKPRPPAPKGEAALRPSSGS